MIIQRAEEKVQVTGSVQRFQAGIAINAETFSILIDGIYNDKVLAAVREPLFNAVDSHTEAKCKDKPIIIHSPTDLEPWYSVRDQGLGMSFDMVTQTFMMLGDSTKRASNELVGAKGIGSKAPFTVTDMFTVTSVKDGLKTIYSVHKNEGIPEVVPLHEERTEEGNGVEIKFNVDPSETSKYRMAIVKCLRYAKFPYEINDPFVSSEIHDRTYPIQYQYTDPETGWSLEMYSSVSSNADSVVVMGQQPYKSEFLTSNNTWPLMMVSIPIGDCDVNPGREWTIEGKNDKGFSERLKAFVTRALDIRGEEIVKELKDLKTLKEVLEHMKAIGGYFSYRYGSAYISERFEEHFGAFRIGNCVTYGEKGTKRLTEKEYSYTDMTNGYPLVFNDDNKFIRSKCQYLSEQRNKRVYVTDRSKAFHALQDPFFDGMIFKLSELEKPPAKKRESYGGYGYYEPGHKVWVINQDGTIVGKRISRADFNSIKVAMIYSGGQSRGSCILGSVEYLENKRQPETFLSDLGVEGIIHIVPLNRVGWLPEGTRIIEQEDIYKVAEKGLFDYCLQDAKRYTTYNHLMTQLRQLGVKVKEDEPYVKRVNMTYSLSNIDSYDSLYAKAKRIVAVRERMAQKLITAKKEKYPLLKHIDLKYYDSPEMIEYRQFIDSKGEK